MDVETSEPAPGVAVHEPETDRSKIGDVIEVWFKDHFIGTALSATTELYNLGHAAKQDLKERLTKV